MQQTQPLISHQADIDKIYLYAKDPFEAKDQLLIDKCEVAGIKHFNNSKAYINIEKCNLNKKYKTNKLRL